MTVRGLLGAAAITATLGAGCIVKVDSFQPDGGGGDVTQPTDFDPGPSPVRRLTNVEYNNTVADLLGDSTAPATGFPANTDETNQTFSNNVALQAGDEEMMTAYLSAAQTLAATATTAANLPKLLPASCNPSAIDTTCIDAFLDAFGEKAFRRPLTADEQTALLGVYTTGAAQFDPVTGVQLLLTLILTDPSFLYRPEFGQPDTGADPADAFGSASVNHVPLTSWEMASRLSYFLWGSMPDDELFAAAQADQLRTADQVAQQAKRLLQDPRAHATVKQFHDEWLELDTLFADAEKDASTWPTYAAVQPLLQQETEAFFENVVWSADGDLPTLLTASYSYMNADLASFYGISGVSGSDFVKVNVDPASRAGFLTQASLLAENAHLDDTSPTLRGKFVLGQLLCTVPPPPPGDTPPAFPTPTPGETIRDQVEQHDASGCGGTCHAEMDPIGLGLEQYDAAGIYTMARDSGSGALAISDQQGSFTGGVELAQRLAASDDVARCMTTQWFRWAAGRTETADDQPNLDALATGFLADGENIQDLLVTIASSDMFRYRRPLTAGSNP